MISACLHRGCPVLAQAHDPLLARAPVHVQTQVLEPIPELEPAQALNLRSRISWPPQGDYCPSHRSRWCQVGDLKGALATKLLMALKGRHCQTCCKGDLCAQGGRSLRQRNRELLQIGSCRRLANSARRLAHSPGAPPAWSGLRVPACLAACQARPRSGRLACPAGGQLFQIRPVVPVAGTSRAGFGRTRRIVQLQ